MKQKLRVIENFELKKSHVHRSSSPKVYGNDMQIEFIYKVS